MFKLLPAVPETCESIESLSSERKPVRNNSKKSTIYSEDSSMFSIINSNKDHTSKIFNQKNKENLKNFRSSSNNSENIKKQQEIFRIRAEFQIFKEEKASLKVEENTDLEYKKKMIQLAKQTLRQSIAKNKEDLMRKNQEKKQKIFQESKENENFIKRREAYYLKKLREKSTEENKHKRVKSENNSEPNPGPQICLLNEIKNQQDVIRRLENLLNEEKNLSVQLKNSKIIQDLKDSRFNVNKFFVRSRSSLKNTKLSN